MLIGPTQDADVSSWAMAPAYLNGPNLTLALVEEAHVRWLRHEDDVLRLYVIHSGSS